MARLSPDAALLASCFMAVSCLVIRGRSPRQTPPVSSAADEGHSSAENAIERDRPSEVARRSL